MSSFTQTILNQISVFATSFDLTSLISVVILPNDIDLIDKREKVIKDSLSQLVRRSFIDYDHNNKRYRQHDLVKIFASGKLKDDLKVKDVELHHAKYYFNLLTEIDKLFEKGGDALKIGLKLFELEWENIQIGQSWSISHPTEEAARLCSEYPNAGAYILALRQLPLQRIEWRKNALSCAEKIGDRDAEGLHLGNLGVAYYELGNIPRAIEYFEQRLLVAREVHNRRGEGNALGNLGLAYDEMGDFFRAIEYFEQQLAIVQEIGDRRGEANGRGNLGLVYYKLRNMQQAKKYAEEQLSLSLDMEEPRGQADALNTLGDIFAAQHSIDIAIDYYQQAISIAQQIGHRQVESDASWQLGKIFVDQGNIELGIKLMQVGVDYQTEIKHILLEERIKEFEQIKQRIKKS